MVNKSKLPNVSILTGDSLNQIDPAVVKIEIAHITSTSVISMPTSASPKAWKTFDYATLDTSTSQFVQQQTGEIRGLMKRTVESIFEIGQRLIVVKERLGHGRFGSWLETEFEWSQDTANNFINVAKKFGKFPNFSEFDMAASALYMLAAPSTPEAARSEAISRAARGESISFKTAKNIKQKYTAPALKPEATPKQSEQLVEKLPSNGTMAPSQPSIKQEIIAIRSPTQVEVRSGASQSIMPTTAQTLVLPQPAPLVPREDVPGAWWQLGTKHLLYSGDPNSPGFLARVPDNLGLLLAFPATRQWQALIEAETRIITNKYLPKGKDVRLFEDTLESNILLYSNIGEVVVSCFVPSVEILSIINRQDRRALLAEPDSKRVNAIISDWKLAGLKAERLG